MPEASGLSTIVNTEPPKPLIGDWTVSKLIGKLDVAGGGGGGGGGDFWGRWGGVGGGGGGGDGCARSGGSGRGAT